MKTLYLDGRLFNGTEQELLAIKKFYCKDWFKNGNQHREDGPAHIRSDGTELWYQNGLSHRIDGPAKIWPSGTNEYFLDGVQYSKYDFDIASQLSKNANPIIPSTAEDILQKIKEVLSEDQEPHFSLLEEYIRKSFGMDDNKNFFKQVDQISKKLKEQKIIAQILNN